MKKPLPGDEFRVLFPALRIAAHGNRYRAISPGFHLVLNNRIYKDTLPDVFTPLADTLRQLMEHPFAERYRETVDYNNVAEVCFRLGELLPIDNREKQLLLETETAQQMLDLLTLHINAMQS